MRKYIIKQTQWTFNTILHKPRNTKNLETTPTRVRTITKPLTTIPRPYKQILKMLIFIPIEPYATLTLINSKNALLIVIELSESILNSPKH